MTLKRSLLAGLSALLVATPALAADLIWQAATQHTPLIKEQLLRLLAALPDS